MIVTFKQAMEAYDKLKSKGYEMKYATRVLDTLEAFEYVEEEILKKIVQEQDVFLAYMQEYTADEEMDQADRADQYELDQWMQK